MEFVCSTDLAVFPLAVACGLNAQRQVAEGRVKLCVVLLCQLGKMMITGQTGDFTTAVNIDMLQRYLKPIYALLHVYINTESNEEEEEVIEL